MISAAVGALIVLVLSIALQWGKDRDGALDPPALFEAEPGTCMNWNRPDASDIREVPCGAPHLFEVTGKTDLSGRYGEDAPFPDARQWQRIKEERCTRVANGYLRGKFDPDGRFGVGAFTPSRHGWESGDRTLQCGVQQPGPSGKLYEGKGRIAQVDQSNTYPAGRCLGINGTAVWDPVDCAKPHAVEVVGIVDLSKEFPKAYPEVPKQDEFLSTRCGELGARYAGGPQVIREKGLVTYWDTLSRESWETGSRSVNCKVSAQLPDGSGLAPVTGTVKGKVEVGEKPAPESPEKIQPGVPAGRTR